MRDVYSIEIGFGKMMEQASMTSKDFMSNAIRDAADVLGVTEAEAVESHKDIVVQLAQGASIDFAAGTVALIIQNAHEGK